MPPRFLQRPGGTSSALRSLIGGGSALSDNELAMALVGGQGQLFTASYKAALDYLTVTGPIDLDALSAQALLASDFVTGSATLDAAASTDVTVTGCVAGSFALFSPTNAAAATLMAGASSIYVVTGTDKITLSTADASSAAGTETFKYIVKL